MANGLDLTTLTSVLSVTTFIIGILLGVIIKRAIKLALAIVALVSDYRARNHTTAVSPL